MTRADVHTLVGAYVLDALDPAEYALVEEHLAACEACAEEVAELRSVIDRLATDVATTPPAALRGTVLDEAARTRQLASRPTANPVRRSPRPRPGPDSGPGPGLPSTTAAGSGAKGCSPQSPPRWQRCP